MYEERSQSRGLLMWVKYGLLIALLFWLGYEWKGYQERNFQDIRLVIYALLMCLFWFWLYGFTYTIQVEKNEIRVIRTFWNWKRTLVVRRGEMSAICDLFSRKYCRALGIRKFLHQYSWADDRQTRVVVFRSDSGSKPKALMFRGSHQLLEVLEKNYPHLMVYIEK